MARRPDPAPARARPPADDGTADQRAADHLTAERRATPWWRLRTWRKDLDALTRLREGLRALDQEEAARGAGKPAEPLASAPATPPVADVSATTVAGFPAATVVGPSATAAAARAADAGADTRAGTAVGVDAGTAAGPGSEAGPGSDQDSGSEAGTGADPAIVAIRDSFAFLAAAGDEAVGYFYAWLFLRQPGLRRLFPPAMDEQRDRLFAALGRIVDSLSTPDEMASYLTQLGRDHRKYGVLPEMYDAVGEALIAALRAFAGSAFTPAAEEAWTQTYAAAAALMIRAAEENAAVAPASWRGEVVHVDYRGRDIAVVTIAPDDVLSYQAGQHLTLQTPRWPYVWRPYSIACKPRDDNLISLHVKAVPGGWVSGALVRHTEPGDEVTLGPAMGTMTLAPAGNRDLLCVAGGTGLAPIKAIIEQAIRESATRRRQIFLFYGARKRDELYDMKDLWRLADAYHGLQLMPVTSDDPAFNGMQGNVGRVAARYLPHTDCEAYVAGPPDMVRETIRVLGRAGIERERTHYDDALLAARPRVGSGM